MKLITNLPVVLGEKISSNTQFDYAGAIIENEGGAIVGNGDENALQPCALEEDAAQSEGRL